MDTKKMLDELARVDKEKAQLELRQAQLAERKDELAKRLAALGVNPAELDAEVSRLQSVIREKMESIRTGPVKTQAVRSKATTPAADDDIMSALEDS